jgi:hypothetical protein
MVANTKESTSPTFSPADASSHPIIPADHCLKQGISSDLVCHVPKKGRVELLSEHYHAGLLQPCRIAFLHYEQACALNTLHIITSWHLQSLLKKMLYSEKVRKAHFLLLLISNHFS